MFYQKGALANFAKFTGKYLCQSLFYNKVAGLGLWYRCFPLNFVKLLKTSFSYRTPPVAASVNLEMKRNRFFLMNLFAEFSLCQCYQIHIMPYFALGVIHKSISSKIADFSANERRRLQSFPFKVKSWIRKNLAVKFD